MALPDQTYHIPPEKWPGLLTDDLKAHFERLGEELVRWDVSNHNYGEPEKHFAALYWLSRNRKARQKQSNAILVVTVLTLIAAVGAILVTIYPVQSNDQEETVASPSNEEESWTLSLYARGGTLFRLEYLSMEKCLSAGDSYIADESAERFDCGLNCEDSIDLTKAIRCERVCNSAGCR